jgi:hypothetical protein
MTPVSTASPVTPLAMRRSPWQYLFLVKPQRQKRHPFSPVWSASRRLVSHQPFWDRRRWCA